MPVLAWLPLQVRLHLAEHLLLARHLEEEHLRLQEHPQLWVAEGLRLPRRVRQELRHRQGRLPEPERHLQRHRDRLLPERRRQPRHVHRRREPRVTEPNLQGSPWRS